MPKKGGRSGSSSPSSAAGSESGLRRVVAREVGAAELPDRRDPGTWQKPTGSPLEVRTLGESEQQQFDDAALRAEIQAKISAQVASGATQTPTRARESGESAALPESDISPVPRAAASPATAWWLAQHGADVPLSPGAAAQLKVRERSAWAEPGERKASPACSSPNKAPASGRRTMSHDGLGSRPLSREFLTPSSTDPFPQEAYTASLDQPEVMPSPHGGHEDRHHTHVDTMDVALSCWRRGEVGAQPKEPSPVPSSARSDATSWTVAMGGDSQIYPPQEECFDAESPHHPEGHWNQIKREGEISARLTASALGRTTSNGSIFVDADAVGALGSGQSSFGKPASPAQPR
jgi:hypothetical protein